MLNAIIIEDEKPAIETLVRTLSQVQPEVRVQARLSSVEESISYLQQHEVPADIIFSDVQLSDGLSFEIFNKTQINLPVIFITGYDQFMMNAFEYNGIDFLLKPVDRQELEKSLHKYRMLERHFTESNASIRKLIDYIDHSRKKRIVVRKGMENISLRIEDVVLFYTEHKIVFAIDRFGKKYLADKNLSDLLYDLDDKSFFRANRQYIVNINFIKGFKTFEKVKLQLDLSVPEIEHSIIVSQETAPAFRKWMQEA